MPTTPPRLGGKKLRRAEKAIENRRAFLRAGAKVVAKYGYAEASIARIAEEAGLAQGTFYLYFPTRQCSATLAPTALAHIVCEF